MTLHIPRLAPRWPAGPASAALRLAALLRRIGLHSASRWLLRSSHRSDGWQSVEVPCYFIQPAYAPLRSRLQERLVR